MIGAKAYPIDSKAFFFLMALLFSLPSRGAMPESLPIKTEVHGRSVVKSTPSTSYKKVRPLSSIASLMIKHPKVFLRSMKGVARNYLRTHKLYPIQDGKLTEADQKAKTSVILGAVALAISWFPYTLIPAIILAVLSLLMARKAQEMGSEKTTGKNLAIAALVVSTLVVLISVLVLVSLFTGMNLLFNW